MTSSAIDERIPAYGFKRPDVREARAAIERVYGAAADAVWAETLRGAGLATVGHIDPDDELERVIAAMRGHTDPVVGLCAQALAIRHQTFRHLSTTHDVMVGAA